MGEVVDITGILKADRMLREFRAERVRAAPIDQPEPLRIVSTDDDDEPPRAA